MALLRLDLMLFCATMNFGDFMIGDEILEMRDGKTLSGGNRHREARLLQVPLLWDVLDRPLVGGGSRSLRATHKIGAAHDTNHTPMGEHWHAFDAIRRQEPCYVLNACIVSDSHNRRRHNLVCRSLVGAGVSNEGLR